MNRRVACLLLLSVCVAQSLGCSPASERDRNAWREAREKRHVDSVVAIISAVVDRIKRYADEVGSSAAQSCYDESRQLLLLDLSSNGEEEVRRCIESADTELIADECCYELQSLIGEESMKVALAATSCIDKARLSYR
ncbi:uncharacterized protein LOC131666476 [Phymastichus coffea]|uniref:uncharacterized protein LOC131666476 n=1 Tax=Phymastichus coffea TaxID=108790 RepID=UPI00273C6ADA|nr:uncharacterized protein LOC131666476 [Phymastichus coffea]